MHCPNCGARMSRDANICIKCGTRLSQIKNASHQEVQKAKQEFQPEKIVYTKIWPHDLKFVPTLLLCIFLGTFGAHYFYVKRPIPGIIFLVCWCIFLGFIIITGASTNYTTIPTFTEEWLKLLSVVIYMIGALVVVYWITDIIRIAFKRFKVPVVLADK